MINKNILIHYSFSEQFAWTWTGTVFDNTLHDYWFGNRYSRTDGNNFTAASDILSEEESTATVFRDSSKNELVTRKLDP